MAETARSLDGTRIAYERTGHGDPLVILGGALQAGSDSADLARLLEPHFTVFTVDRRGRGASGDTAPYAREREIEDVAAIVHAVGGTAFVYGHSSGAVLALEAAAAGVDIARLAVYEPPYTVAEDQGGGDGGGWGDAIQTALDAGDREGAVRAFIGTEAPAEWATRYAPLAHTLPYDIAMMGDGSIPGRLGGISLPTLLMVGGASDGWAQRGMRALDAVIRPSVLHVVEGQDHEVAAAAVAPLLEEFFG